jgi:hypothetical protein
MSPAALDKVKLIGAAVVSLVLLIAGLYILIFKNGASDALQKAATGWIGLVVGYWLK